MSTANPLGRSEVQLQSFDDMQKNARSGDTYVAIPNTDSVSHEEIIAADHATDEVDNDALNLPGIPPPTPRMNDHKTDSKSQSSSSSGGKKAGPSVSKPSIVLASPIPPKSSTVDPDDAFMVVANERMDLGSVGFPCSTRMCSPCRGNPKCIGCNCVGAFTCNGENDEHIGAVITATETLMDDRRFVPSGCACIPAFCCCCCKKSCMENPDGSCAVVLCRQSWLRKCCSCYSSSVARAATKKWSFIGVVIAFILAALALGLVSHFLPQSFGSR